MISVFSWLIFLVGFVMAVSICFAFFVVMVMSATEGEKI